MPCLEETGPGSAEPQCASFDCDGPTAVGATAFHAVRTRAGVRVRWQTATDLGTAGFNVWRSTGRAYRRVNARLIAAEGGVVGRRYEYLDRPAGSARTLRYKLELVRDDGTRRWIGPVTVTKR